MIFSIAPSLGWRNCAVFLFILGAQVFGSCDIQRTLVRSSGTSRNYGGGGSGGVAVVVVVPAVVVFFVKQGQNVYPSWGCFPVKTTLPTFERKLIGGRWLLYWSKLSYLRMDDGQFWCPTHSYCCGNEVPMSAMHSCLSLMLLQLTTFSLALLPCYMHLRHPL